MDRGPTPPLLPVFRSLQQAEILTLLLGDAATELSLTDGVACLSESFEGGLGKGRNPAARLRILPRVHGLRVEWAQQ